MIQHIHEPIDVLASFSAAGKLIPKKFRWHGRVYEISMIHQTHESRDGKAILYFFHCSDAASPYRKLSFNTLTKIWVLEETEVDPE